MARDSKAAIPLQLFSPKPSLLWFNPQLIKPLFSSRVPRRNSPVAWIGILQGSLESGNNSKQEGREEAPVVEQVVGVFCEQRGCRRPVNPSEPGSAARIKINNLPLPLTHSRDENLNHHHRRI